MNRRSARAPDPSIRLRTAGPQGFMVEFGDSIAPETNRRVHLLAARLAENPIDGVLETVPGYRSLLVFFDPLRLGRNELKKMVLGHAGMAGSPGAVAGKGRVVTVPVCYGGEFGPDLDFVARRGGLTPEAAAALHSSREYPVYMLGFTPGFPYLGGLPERISAPRLETPRALVAAGSVGIAGCQTGIYPVDSPGGWRIIGRTPLRIFDPGADTPFLLSAGDWVRFEPVDRSEFDRIAAGLAGPAGRKPLPGRERSVNLIAVIRPGFLTTVQDEGRFGYRAFGMPVSGAMDRRAYRLANILAGNEPGAACLEMTLTGGSFRFEREAFAAVCGAEMSLRLNNEPVRNWSGFPVPAGGELVFGHAADGCRTYLAVRGGIDVPLILGSRSTCLRAGLGGHLGRALRTGDLLPVGMMRGAMPVVRVLSRRAVPKYPGEIILRAIPGPQDDLFGPEEVDAFFDAVYTVSPRNDRMGYLLQGEALRHRAGADIISDAVCIGAVQIPGDGRPIVMTADHQTIGGYAKIATVIPSDLFRLAQARQGTGVRFARCGEAEAVLSLRREQAMYERIRAAVEAKEG